MNYLKEFLDEKVAQYNQAGFIENRTIGYGIWGAFALCNV